MEVDAIDLRAAVEQMHNCTARLIQSVPVREVCTRNGGGRASYMFSRSPAIPKLPRPMLGHPNRGSDKRRFFTVLHQPPITSPVEAVSAAIVAEQKAKAR